MKNYLIALCGCCLLTVNLQAQEADSISATRILPAELAGQDAPVPSAANQDPGTASVQPSGSSVMEVEGFTTPQPAVSEGWGSLSTMGPCCQQVPYRPAFRSFQRPMLRRNWWRPRAGIRGC